MGGMENAHALASILACEASYLGLPLGAKFEEKSIWEPVVERFGKIFSGWKTKYLSEGTRVTLIKSVLSRVPAYICSLFRIPSSMANQLEAIQRRFMWGSFEDDFRCHLVKWNIVKQPSPKGGLGIKDFIIFNEAIFGKWLWRFMNEKDELWKVVIEAKHGTEGLNWIPSNGSYYVGLWTFIIRGWDCFFSNIVFEVGDGSSIFF